MHPAPRTLEDKKRWIERSVAPTLKMIQKADEETGEDFLTKAIENARMKEHQEKIVKDYLQGHKELKEQWIHEKKKLEAIVKLQKEGFFKTGNIEVPFK